MAANDHRRSQLDLFASEDVTPPHAAELLELGERIPGHIRFGTSSWTFDGWKGRVYRESYASRQDFTRRSLEEYAQYPLFRTVSIDSSYYRPLDAQTLTHYSTMLPDDFRCIMKAWSEICCWRFPHSPRYAERAGRENPHFLDIEVFQKAVLSPIGKVFRKHIGAFLFAIPPVSEGIPSGRFQDKLAQFLEGVPPGYQYAFELRNPELLTPGYFELLREHGGVHCYNYWNRMPSIAEQQTFDRGLLPGPVVVRLMLPPGRTYAALKKAWAPFQNIVEPQPTMRRDVIDLCMRAAREDREIYIIANNKAEGSSPLTIEALARGVTE